MLKVLLSLFWVSVCLPSKDLKHRDQDVSEPEHVAFYSKENRTSDKKLMRRGVLIRKPNAKGTVLICHGFMCDKYDVSFLHLMFKDYNSMTFDFRAHGEDIENQCCTFGRDESFDVIGAAEFLKNHPELKDQPLFVYGFSMGAVASIVAQAQEKNLFDGMILDCPFDSSDKLIDRAFNQLKMNFFGYEFAIPGVSLLRSYAYNQYVQSFIKMILRTFTKFDTVDINTIIHPVYPEEAIKYVSVPCFFIGCTNDNKAPEEAVLSIYHGAKGYKRCWIDTEGKRHFDTIFRQMHKYFYKVDKFLSCIIDGTYKKKHQQKIKKDRPRYYLTAAKPKNK